jgi:uncharacterized repeat protein (TIGR03803 family)
VFDKKGALYGTTFFGGDGYCQEAAGVGCGTVFKLNPPAKEGRAWTYRLLYRFHEGFQANDGENPGAGLIRGKNGAFYGTTVAGGSRTGEGTVFSLTPPARKGQPWDEKILHVFNGRDGWNPLGLILDATGDLCGGASRIGAHGSGTIFRLKRPPKNGRHWVFTVLYNFMPPPDGVGPTGYLSLDKRGNLYGVTQQGGTGPCQGGGCGTVFELTP